jgi:ATP-dependent phosphofructokinase / diphosphate-dependent phosphofructokinase
MATNIKRIGVLTGGGDCAGLNAVIRAVVRSAVGEHQIEVFGIEDGFLGLIEDRVHPLTVADTADIMTRGGTILGTTNRVSPRQFVTGYDADGTPQFIDVTDRVLTHIKQHQLDGLVAIGGDGTMSECARLAGHGVRCVGVPKTIDNDIMHTDVTFGFQTAVEIATEALDRIHTTAASHHRVMIVETMGRHAGWLALHAGIASGADVILLPEIPYDFEVIRRSCEERAKVGKSFTIMAVAEGAHPRGGEVIVDTLIAESPDPVRLGGVSTVIAQQINELSHLECRNTILGHVQRGGAPCAFDRVLATTLGHAAVDLVIAGQWNHMVAVQEGMITSAGIADVAGQQRTVPTDGPRIAAARAVGTCMGDSFERRW